MELGIRKLNELGVFTVFIILDSLSKVTVFDNSLLFRISLMPRPLSTGKVLGTRLVHNGLVQRALVNNQLMK